MSTQSLRHEALFYTDDAPLLDAIAVWLYTAAEQGCALVVIATEPHRLGLAVRLHALGPEYARAVRDRRVVILDAAQTLDRILRDGMPNEAALRQVLQAALQGISRHLRLHHGIAAYGEMVNLLCERGQAPAAVRLEEAWNAALKEYPLSLRCGYRLDSLCTEEGKNRIGQICAAHDGVTSVDSSARRPPVNRGAWAAEPPDAAPSRDAADKAGP